MQRFRQASIHDTIVFFGSARLRADGPLGRYYQQAHELARLITLWSKSLSTPAHRYVVCTGGGGGIMEAANRGAAAAALDALAEELGQDLEAGLKARQQLQLRTALLKVIANLTRT